METQLISHTFSPANAVGGDFEVHARDGYSLGARLWTLPEALSVNNVALINAGAGITSRYYDRFAAFLAESGIPTVVYDYRGIGRSRPRSLKGFRASVEEWGSKDCTAILEWLDCRYPEAKKVVVGHSIGGFVTGFVTNGAMVDRMLLVSAHTGYWGDYSAGTRPVMFLLWHLLMPTITHFVGYFPGQKLRLLEDLPKGVALEWAARRKPDFWWNLRLPNGSLNYALINDLRARFAAIHGHTLALRFTDDPFATRVATERILGLYCNTKATNLVFSPANGAQANIGHFGFFSSRFRKSLWPAVLTALFAVD